MKKLAVLVGGWHYPYGLYETLSKQRIPDGWEIDYFCVGHRMPEDEESVVEKEYVRNYSGNDELMLLDKVLYNEPLSSKHLSDWGWNFILEENTNQILDFTKEVKNMEEIKKIKILETLWKIIYSNKEADIYETNLMRRLAGLLYIDNKIMGDIKEKIKKENQQ